jgi:hypothetical protein
MAVPYPSDRQRSGNGQERDSRIGVASKVVMESIDENLDWESLMDRIAARLRLSLGEPLERSRFRTRS